MKGLDFWATDAQTDRLRPIFDKWSVEFTLRELMQDNMFDELMRAFPEWRHGGRNA